ncbi:hypothetical protein MN032_00095 [Agromyces atrinae]|nr:hypothetical protein [Agromyces atrinae]MCI2956079.1 hypothetical protein [Agromyces atrinae]
MKQLIDLACDRPFIERVDVVDIVGKSEVTERSESLAFVGEVNDPVTGLQCHERGMKSNCDDDTRRRSLSDELGSLKDTEGRGFGDSSTIIVRAPCALDVPVEAPEGLHE